jgi:hypothetical protein
LGKAHSAAHKKGKWQMGSHNYRVLQKEDTMNYAERLAIGERERLEFRKKLELEHGLQNHPKRDRLWELAWEEGHSGGWSEISLVYSELATLLKP